MSAMAEVAPPIEQVLRKIKRDGMRVHNAHQRDDGLWVANLRTAKAPLVNTTPVTKGPISYYGWGRGPDMAGALEAAHDKALKGVKLPGMIIPDDDRLPTDPPMGLEPDSDVDTLIANLLD